MPVKSRTPELRHPVDATGHRGPCRAAGRGWTAGRRTVGVVVVVALVCLGLAVSGASAAAEPIPTCTASIPNCTPPPLLNESELTPVRVGPERLYVATPAQREALQAFERQAVENALSDYHLPAGDAAAMQSWGRPDALAELWGLVVQAIHASNPTPDQREVVAWLTAVMHRRAKAEAEHAGWEYLKWAGLLPGNKPIPAQSTLVDLLHKVDRSATAPIQYDTGTSQTATSGFCKWQPPAPFEAEYTGNVSTPPDKRTAQGWCYPPYHCINPLGCNDNQPSYDDFVKYGSADLENGRANRREAAVLTAQEARALAFGGAAVGAGIAGVALASTLGTTVLATTVTSTTLTYIVDALSVVGGGFWNSVAGAGVSLGSAVGAVVGVVIVAAAVATLEGIRVVNAAKVPGRLSSLITGAASGTPDLKAMLTDSQKLAGLLGVFTGAAVPTPSLKACDNRALGVVGVGINPAPCLNAPPIPAPAKTDPQFLITPKGGGATRSDTLSWTDRDASGSLTTQATARMSGHWFVTHITAAVGAGLPVASTPDFQSVSIHYVGWDQKGRTAWLVPQGDGRYRFLIELDGHERDPSTCLAKEVCTLSDHIEYIRKDSLSAPTVRDYSATVVAGQRPNITIRGLPFSRILYTEGAPWTFLVELSGGVGPFTERWYFQNATSGLKRCIFPASEFCGYDGPFSGNEVSYTPQAPGHFRVALLVTDADGRTYEHSFNMIVEGVPPVLVLGKTEVRTVALGTPTILTGEVHHRGRDDTESVTVDWGNGSSSSFTLRPGVIFIAPPGVSIHRPSPRQLDFSFQHTYAAAGTYHVTVTAADGAGGSDSQTTTETVNP